MNSEAKHTSEARFTPGPWGCREPNGSGMGWKIGPAWLGEKPGTEETKANARLIAAAPDLLAFAQEFLSDYGSEDGMNSMKYYAMVAQRVIAKAKGETAT